MKNAELLFFLKREALLFLLVASSFNFWTT
uniref:Uncharacterized protein n=1 Tax=Arundo donax TaxID=35708 RepID=A0A0A9ELI1_ARUDO